MLHRNQKKFTIAYNKYYIILRSTSRPYNQQLWHFPLGGCCYLHCFFTLNRRLKQYHKLPEHTGVPMSTPEEAGALVMCFLLKYLWLWPNCLFSWALVFSSYKIKMLNFSKTQCVDSCFLKLHFLYMILSSLVALNVIYMLMIIA